jgi:hypothetical protein
MTNKQKQHLLAYLGYYVGNIDGNWGQLSKVACRSFQQDFGGIAVDGICGVETEKALQHAVAYGIAKKNYWDGIKYFNRSEFACKCGKYCNGYPVEMDEQLIKIADIVRDHFGNAITVTSGIRCETHNKNVGGVANSRHLSGKAMDFRVSGIPSSIVLPYVQGLSGIRYAYAIDSNHVHMDVN